MPSKKTGRNPVRCCSALCRIADAMEKQTALADEARNEALRAASRLEFIADHIPALSRIADALEALRPASHEPLTIPQPDVGPWVRCPRCKDRPGYAGEGAYCDCELGRDLLRVRIVILVSGWYPHPEALYKPVAGSTTPVQALAAEIEKHMRAYGFNGVNVLIEKPPDDSWHWQCPACSIWSIASAPRCLHCNRPRDPGTLQSATEGAEAATEKPL